MTDTELKEVQTVLSEVKAEIGKLDGDATIAETEVKSIWQRHEIYMVGFCCVVAGMVLMHLLGK